MESDCSRDGRLGDDVESVEILFVQVFVVVERKWLYYVGAL